MLRNFCITIKMKYIMVFKTIIIYIIPIPNGLVIIHIGIHFMMHIYLVFIYEKMLYAYNYVQGRKINS